jgi:hypothetical protein
VNLPDPVKLGLTIRYFNHDDVTLYFRITGSASGYTFGTVDLGSLASGTDAYKNLDEFASRAKPSASDLPNGEKEENITLILKAYTDSGYTNLKWTYERIVTVHWINSADPAFTVDFLNNFDDGTVQGWTNPSGVGTLAVATDYVLSPPYSLRWSWSQSTGPSPVYNSGVRMQKSFTTPNKDKVFAIIDLRAGGVAQYWSITIQKDSDTLIYLYYPPTNKWMRIVVPLPKNSTVVLNFANYVYFPANTTGTTYLWLDDFKIISK